MTSTDGICHWFAVCDRPSIGTVQHPMLGAVPTCQRCADRHNLTVTPYGEEEPVTSDPFVRDDSAEQRRRFLAVPSTVPESWDVVDEATQTVPYTAVTESEAREIADELESSLTIHGAPYAPGYSTEEG